MIEPQKIKSEVTGLAEDTRNWHAKREYKDMDKESFVDAMKVKYDYLFTNSPTLFERVMQGDLNMGQLEYMLTMIDRVNSGADYHTASVAVGQKLVDVYVKPLIDKKP
jgi:hypothetical protein